MHVQHWSHLSSLRPGGSTGSDTKAFPEHSKTISDGGTRGGDCIPLRWQYRFSRAVWCKAGSSSMPCCWSPQFRTLSVPGSSGRRRSSLPVQARTLRLGGSGLGRVASLLYEQCRTSSEAGNGGSDARWLPIHSRRVSRAGRVGMAVRRLELTSMHTRELGRSGRGVIRRLRLQSSVWQRGEDGELVPGAVQACKLGGQLARELSQVDFSQRQVREGCG